MSRWIYVLLVVWCVFESRQYAALTRTLTGIRAELHEQNQHLASIEGYADKADDRGERADDDMRGVKIIASALAKDRK